MPRKVVDVDIIESGHLDERLDPRDAQTHSRPARAVVAAALVLGLAVGAGGGAVVTGRLADSAATRAEADRVSLLSSARAPEYLGQGSVRWVTKVHNRGEQPLTVTRVALRPPGGYELLSEPVVATPVDIAAGSGLEVTLELRATCTPRPSVDRIDRFTVLLLRVRPPSGREREVDLPVEDPISTLPARAESSCPVPVPDSALGG